MKKQITLSGVTSEAHMVAGRIGRCAVSFTGVMSFTPSEINRIDLEAFAKQPIMVDVPLKQMTLSDAPIECILNEIIARIERS